MNLTVSTKSDRPIYEQLYEQISGQILRGELSADFCLPSIRTVARELGISVITVKSAYDRLEREGFLYTRAGKGCFVAPHKAEGLNLKRLALAEERLRSQLGYYRSLQLTKEEFIALADKLYDER